jgi:hypothetical protein
MKDQIVAADAPALPFSFARPGNIPLQRANSPQLFAPVSVISAQQACFIIREASCRQDDEKQ